MCLDNILYAIFIAMLCGANVFLIWILIMAINVNRREKKYHYAMFPESKIKKSWWR